MSKDTFNSEATLISILLLLLGLPDLDLDPVNMWIKACKWQLLFYFGPGWYIIVTVMDWCKIS